MKCVVVFILVIFSTPGFSAYSRVSDVGPFTIDSIAVNEWGSPVVKFNEAVNSACNGGGKILYLYNLELSPVEEVHWEFRKTKMSVLLSAKMASKRVRLDYYFDNSISGHAACYINGIILVD